MLESDFQSNLKHKLKKIFPGCIVFKTPANLIQGFPDLLILYGKHWACLECKKSRNSSKRPNQNFWVEVLNGMSFARFIFPENEREVLHELECFFSD